MADQTLLDLPLSFASARFPDEVPHEDARVGRPRDQDLLVELQAQDRPFVPSENLGRASGGDVPNPDSLIPLFKTTRESAQRGTI